MFNLRHFGLRHFKARHFPPSGIITVVVAGIAGAVKRVSPTIVFDRIKAIVEFKV